MSTMKVQVKVYLDKEVHDELWKHILKHYKKPYGALSKEVQEAILQRIKSREEPTHTHVSDGGATTIQIRDSASRPIDKIVYELRGWKEITGKELRALVKKYSSPYHVKETISALTSRGVIRLDRLSKHSDSSTGRVWKGKKETYIYEVLI